MVILFNGIFRRKAMFINFTKDEIFMLVSLLVCLSSASASTGEDTSLEKFNRVYRDASFSGFEGKDTIFEEVVTKEPSLFTPEQRLVIGDYLVHKDRLDQAAVWFKAGFVDPTLKDMRTFDSFKTTARHLSLDFDELVDQNNDETFAKIKSILERQKSDRMTAVEGFLAPVASKSSGASKRSRDEQESYVLPVFVAWYIIDLYQKSFGALISSVVLQKAILAADILSIKNCGKSITHASLKNWEEGPVYREVWDVFKRYTGRDRVIRIPTGEMKEVSLGENQRVFINRIVSRLGEFDNRKISDLSHREAVWLATPKDEEISADFMEIYYKDHSSFFLSGVLGETE